MLTPICFGDFNLKHIKPGQVLARFVDPQTVIEAMRIVHNPVGQWDVGSKNIKISVPVDQYVVDGDTWRFKRVAREVGHVFRFQYAKPSTSIGNPWEAHRTHRERKKSVYRRWHAKNQRIEGDCWVSTIGSSDWYPISDKVAKKLGIGRKTQDKLTPDKIYRSVLCDPSVELVSSRKSLIPKVDSRTDHFVEPSLVYSNFKPTRLSERSDDTWHSFKF